MNNKNNSNNQERVSYKWLFIPIALAILLCAANLLILIVYPLTQNDGPGTFGDMFGVSNALFSGLVFAGLIYAILLQKKELELQRKELKYTRKELKGQKVQLEGQKKQLEIQNFENRFFSLLTLLNNIVSSFRHHNENPGRFSIHLFNQNVANSFSQTQKDNRDMLSAFSSCYNRLNQGAPEEGYIYLSQIHSILIQIDKLPYRKEVKNVYAQLFANTLSQAELGFIFLNLMSKNFSGNLFLLAQNYKIFRNFEPEHLRHDIFKDQFIKTFK